MIKNNSRNISINQYRMTDNFLFAGLLIVAEVLIHFAAVWFPTGALFTFSPLLIFTVLISIRWGWESLILAVIHGALYCLLNQGSLQNYVIYIIGNLWIALPILIFKLTKWKVEEHWSKLSAYTLTQWIAIVVGRTLVSAIWMAAEGKGFPLFTLLGGFAISELMTLVVSIVVLVVLRKLNGMVENQKSYLLRLKREREEKMRRDTFGDEPVEIDEETLSILHKGNDLYD